MWIDSEIEKPRCCSTHLNSSSPKNYPTAPRWFFSLQNWNWRLAFPNFWLRCKCFHTRFFFLLWWVPNGSTYWKQHTTVVDPKFNPNMPADFLQIKVQIKRTLNLWHSSQYHVCKMYKPDPPEKIFSFWLFPTFSYGPYNTWEVWNDTQICGGISFL